jgi:hypothetical protein
MQRIAQNPEVMALTLKFAFSYCIIRDLLGNYYTLTSTVYNNTFSLKVTFTAVCTKQQHNSNPVENKILLKSCETSGTFLL